MSEETDAPQGGTEGIPSTVDTSIEDNAADTTAQDAGTDDTGLADDAGAEPKPKQVPWFQKRIDELTAKRYESEREAAYWRGKAESLPQQQAPQVEETVPDRWDDPEGYDRWLIQQAKKEVQAELARERVTSTYAERVAKAREAKPDYDQIVSNPNLPITDLMAQLIQESDQGPDVAYHLGTNPQEAARIAALPQHLQAKELGKLEAKLSQPKAPVPTRTPPPAPPQTVSGLSVGLNKAPEEQTMAEYVADMKAQGRL